MIARSSIFSFGVRQKMLAILMAVLVVAISISSWFTLQKQEKDLYNAISIRGEEVVKHAAHAISLYAVSYDYHGIQILLDEIVNSPDIIHGHVTSSKGNIMATAGPTAGEGEQRPTFQRSLIFDNREVGKLTVQLDPRDIVRRVEENRNDLLLRELALIILVAIGEFIGLSYFIARPVSIISNSLQESVDKDGRISKNIPLESKDEFGRLASQFNLMREQLNAAHAKLQDRIEAADARLLETNQALRQQSEALKEMNKRLVELSITDPLTGLYNRRHFESMITKELAHSARHGNCCSLMIMDIDHFKNINDSYGHAVGDEVLRRIADIIRENIRSADIPCRIGGEEFVVACRNTNELEATQLAERLRGAAAQSTIQLEELSIDFTMSIGIATLRTGRNKLTLDTIFEHADRALYHSKQHGRNRVTHHTELEQSDTGNQGANS